MPRNLSRTLGNPLYGGWLAYKGEIITRLAEVEPIMDADTYDAVQAKLGARKRGRRQTGKYPLSGVLACGNPACPRRGTMAGYTRSGGRRAYVCAPANGGCGQSVLAEPVEASVRDAGAGRAGRRGAAGRGCAPPTPSLDEQRAKLRGLLADLDADMAETEAKLRDMPRAMTRRREQFERNLAAMEARYEAAERELTELGPAVRARPAAARRSRPSEWDNDIPGGRRRRRPSAVSACASRSCRPRARRARRGCRSMTGGSRSSPPAHDRTP